MIFVYEIFHLPIIRDDLLRQCKVSPVWTDSIIQDWLWKVWQTPYKNWSFQLFLSFFLEKDKNISEKIVDLSNIALWIAILEEYNHRSHTFMESTAMKEVGVQLNELEKIVKSNHKKAQSLKQICDERLTLIETQDNEVKMLKGVCDERLVLIENLTTQLLMQKESSNYVINNKQSKEISDLKKVCEKNLQTMQSQENHIEKLKNNFEKEQNKLEKICQERLQLIENQHKQIQLLNKVCEERLLLIQQLNETPKKSENTY